MLYEGYVLYPYRASARKNQIRWQFGVLMPPGYVAADPSERSAGRTEVCSSAKARPVGRSCRCRPRFLHVAATASRRRLPASWDEAVERQSTLDVRGRRTALRGRRARVRRVPAAADEPATTASRRSRPR